MPHTVIGLMLLPGRRALGGRPPLTFRSISVSLDEQINFVTLNCSSNVQSAENKTKSHSYRNRVTEFEFPVQLASVTSAGYNKHPAK